MSVGDMEFEGTRETRCARNIFDSTLDTPQGGGLNPAYCGWCLRDGRRALLAALKLGQPAAQVYRST